MNLMYTKNKTIQIWNNIVPFLHGFGMLIIFMVYFYSIRFNFKPYLLNFQAYSSKELKETVNFVFFPSSLATSIVAE